VSDSSSEESNWGCHGLLGAPPPRRGVHGQQPPGKRVGWLLSAEARGCCQTVHKASPCDHDIRTAPAQTHPATHATAQAAAHNAHTALPQGTITKQAPSTTSTPHPHHMQMAHSKGSIWTHIFGPCAIHVQHPERKGVVRLLCSSDVGCSHYMPLAGLMSPLLQTRS
jgi:hypothetical protein